LDSDQLDGKFSARQLRHFKPRKGTWLAKEKKKTEWGRRKLNRTRGQNRRREGTNGKGNQQKPPKRYRRI
jgi:hypothetical protein